MGEAATGSGAKRAENVTLRAGAFIYIFTPDTRWQRAVGSEAALRSGLCYYGG